MIITPLGHTEFLVDITNTEGENVRILVDTWLSDYAVGDLMERSVKVRLDPSRVGMIDAIYISHSHTDHLDPYTLVEIFGSPLDKGGQGDLVSETGEQNLQSSASPQTVPLQRSLQKPLLFLPFTLAYLVPLLHEYFGDIRIQILYPDKSFILNGIEITGHMFTQSEITNEDDVMMLSVSNDRELLFAEIDTLPEDDNLDVQNELFKILTKKDYETVCYLASRNELSGQLPILDIPEKRRVSVRAEYIANRKDEMYASYQKYEYEDFAEFPNIYEIPNLVRGFIGQGIRYPQGLSLELAQMQIFPLAEIASMESDIARECGYEFPQKALLPGRQYRVENGNIEQGRKECPIGEIVKNEQGIESNEKSQDRLYASGPLFPRELSEGETIEGKKRILDVLNARFLPYWSASPIASLREALVKNEGVYRIELKMNNEPGKIVFEYSIARSGFMEVPFSEHMKIDEGYWLLDVLDFLDGRQELYSNFWHKLDPKRIYRLWTCLGANFCNHDLVERKYRLHFERAKQGKTVNEWVEGVCENL